MAGQASPPVPLCGPSALACMLLKGKERERKEVDGVKVVLVCVCVSLLLAPRCLLCASLFSTAHGSGNGPLCALGVHGFPFGKNFHTSRRGRRGGRRGRAISIF